MAMVMEGCSRGHADDAATVLTEIDLELESNTRRMQPHRMMCLEQYWFNQLRFYRVWMMIISLCCLHSYVAKLLEFGFPMTNNALRIPYIVSQSLLFCDIIVHIFVAYVNRHKYLAKKYMTFIFIVDMIACIPWETISKNLAFLSRSRIFRLIKVHHFCGRMEKEVHINYFCIRISKIILVGFLWSHTAACVLYFLASSQPPGEEGNSWIGSLNLDGDNANYRGFGFWKLYITSMYFSIVTVTTVGYGDIHAVNLREMIFIIIYLISGMILSSYQIGNLTLLIVKDFKTSEKRNQMAELVHYMKRNGISREICTSIKENLLHLQYGQTYNDSAAVFNDIQISIRSQEWVVTRSGLEQSVLRLKEHDCFGEFSIFFDAPQPYDIKACEFSRILWIDKQSVTSIVERFPQDKIQILENLKVKESDYPKSVKTYIKVCKKKHGKKLHFRMNNAAYDGEISELRGLIMAGADPNMTDYAGRSIMHIAAARGDESLVEYLVDEGLVDNNGKDNYGYTPLQEACKNGHRKVVEILKHKAAVLLSADDVVVGTVLRTAVASRDWHIVDLMLFAGCKPDFKNYDDRTTLHLAASHRSVSIAKLLLDSGASVNAKDRWGKTPLHLAASRGLESMANLLLERGASVIIKDRWEKTPTDEAMLNGDEQLIKMLFEREIVEIITVRRDLETRLS